MVSGNGFFLWFVVASYGVIVVNSIVKMCEGGARLMTRLVDRAAICRGGVFLPPEKVSFVVIVARLMDRVYRSTWPSLPKFESEMGPSFSGRPRIRPTYKGTLYWI